MARPVTNPRVHQARLEMAVAVYGTKLWDATTPALDRWVRSSLRAIGSKLERIVLVRAAHHNSPETTMIEALIRHDIPPSSLSAEIRSSLIELPANAALEYGFLPSDPRAKLIERETRAFLESDLFSYWQTLTSPKTLAAHIAELRAKGMHTHELATAISGAYRQNYFAAERLVRTVYNSSTNLAQIQALEEAGYTRKRWITARDSRVRRAGRKGGFDHVRMDGVTIAVKEFFVTPADSRLQYPGDRSGGAPVGEIAHCRCSVIGVLED